MHTKSLLGKIVFLLVFVMLFFPALIFAETIILKSGKSVEGKILERTEKHIEIDVSGVPVTYFIGEIENIIPDKPEASFTTAKITYKNTERILDEKGNPVHEMSGETVKYIDVINNKSRIEEKQTNKMGNFESKEERIDILDGKKMYFFDSQTKEWLFMDLPKDMPVWVEMVASQNDEKNFVGTEDIVGKKCSVYDFEGIKVWIWNGIVLKEETKRERTHNLKEAVSIEENIAMDKKLFEVPAGVTPKSTYANIADTVKKFNSIQDTQKTVEKLEDAGLADLGTAIFDPAAEKKLIDAIKNDVTLTEEKKQESIKNLQEMLAKQRQNLAGARTPDGKTDLNKAIGILEQDREQAKYASARSECMMIVSACELYKLEKNSYPENLSKLGEVNPPHIMPETLKKLNSTEGYLYYRFAYKFIDKDHFQLIATPMNPKLKTIFVDETGKPRLNDINGPEIDIKETE